MMNHKHRFLVSMTAMSVGLLTGAAVAQSTTATQSSQDRTQDRTSEQMSDARPDQLEHLDALAGSWDVELKVTQRQSNTYRDQSDQSDEDTDRLRDRNQTTARTAGEQTFNGSATRRWRLNGFILEETSSFSDDLMKLKKSNDMNDDRTRNRDRGRGLGDRDDQDTNTPRTRTTQSGQDSNSPDRFRSFGVFGFDQSKNAFTHVMTDNAKGQLILSSGRFNESTNTFTFRHHMGDERSDFGSDRRSDQFGDDDSGLDDDDDMYEIEDDDDRIRGFDRQDDQDRSRSTSHLTTRQPVVTLRIVNDNKHIITMRKPGNDGNYMQEYVLTYTRSGSLRTQENDRDRR